MTEKRFVCSLAVTGGEALVNLERCQQNITHTPGTPHPTWHKGLQLTGDSRVLAQHK